MKALAVLMILLALLAMLRFRSMDSQDDQRTEAIALNFAVYRNEVHRYVFSDHKTPGDITTASLDLPAGWVMLRPWHARIEAGCLYVWGEASPEEIAVVRDLYWEAMPRPRGGGPACPQLRWHNADPGLCLRG
jgi:hypothetical protein